MNWVEKESPPFTRFGRVCLGVGIVSLALSSLAALSEPQQFLRSYLVAYFFWVAVPLGSLALLMIHHLVHGRWGHAVRRILEAACRTLPILLVLFLPIAGGLKRLSVSADLETAVSEQLIDQGGLHLVQGAFLAQIAVCFVVWIVLESLLTQASARLDQSGDPRWARLLQRVSGPGLVAYVLTSSIAASDWGMWLDPRLNSTICGLSSIVGQGLAALAFAIIVLHLHSEAPELRTATSPDCFHDLGNLLLAFVVLWAYVSFSQLLIIGSADLPGEARWSMQRLAQGWQWVAFLLLLLHFVVPSAILLAPQAKRRAQVLASVALALLAMRYVDIFSIVVPTFHPKGLILHWLDVSTLIGIGGLWVASFTRGLGRRPLFSIGVAVTKAVMSND